jgi:Uncharacterized protein conserved in bacteria (DUF2252)
VAADLLGPDVKFHHSKLNFKAPRGGEEVKARAHARSGDAAAISGYLGKGDVFGQALGRFATSYADQNALDHADSFRRSRTAV